MKPVMPRRPFWATLQYGEEGQRLGGPAIAAGQPLPPTSILNSFDASLTSNLAVIPAGTNGSINASAGNATNLVLDMSEYFAP